MAALCGDNVSFKCRHARRATSASPPNTRELNMRMLSSAARLLPLVVVAASLAPGQPATRRLAEVPLASLDLAKMKVQAAGGRGGQTQTLAQGNKSIDGNP